jgi:hypothetical protein
MNSLTLQPGQNLGSVQSNDVVPVNNLNAQDAQGIINTNLKGDVPKGGASKRSFKRSRSASRSKKGGSFGAVLSQAAAPAALLAVQQSFGRRRHSRKH